MDEMMRQFRLLKNIIRFSETPEIKIDLTETERIIMHTLPEILEKNAPSNFTELFFDFKQEYERFKSFILYDKLIGKNIVALGGGFSSGKSAFLNSILGCELLPSDISPSTSVPTYLVNGKQTEVYGINTFESKIKMEAEDVSLLAHGFGRENETASEVTLGHLLSCLFISMPKQPFRNLALLDTPGYSKAETIGYSSKTDEKIARNQLNSSNFILWFIPAEGGTITESDIKFIKSLEDGIPKLMIVNKADKVTPDELDEVVEQVKETLDSKGISYVDVLTYSCEEPDDYQRDEIIECLNNWNKAVSQSMFAYNFKVLFTKCNEYYESLLDEQKHIHYQMGYIMADICHLSEDTIEYVSKLDKESVKKRQEIKDIQKELKKIQYDFFSNIKKIADTVKIEMPEPSEIDLLADRFTNSKRIVGAFKSSDTKRGAKKNSVSLFEKNYNKHKYEYSKDRKSDNNKK